MLLKKNIFNKMLKNQNTISTDEILKYATPHSVSSIIKRQPIDTQPSLWCNYIVRTYGIDTNDIKNFINDLSDYPEVASTLNDILETYLHVYQFPSSDLLLHDLVELYENGNLPDVEDTEQESCLVDVMAPFVVPQEPTTKLDASSTKEYFRKHVYNPKKYVLPIGVSEFNFDLAALNCIEAYKDKFNEKLFNAEKQRRYDLVEFELGDSDQSSDDTE